MTDCKICDGWGWVRQDLPSHHPEFGQLVRCECKGGPEEKPEDPRVEQWRSRKDVEPFQEEIPF